MIYNLEYNSERSKLFIPEYGRHIQKMVEHALTIDDDVERNKIAKTIIAVMGNLNPHLRDVPDFQHKLWDQLFIISDFKLDVDSPFPIPTREEVQEHPDSMDYPQNHPKYRFYGNNIKRMIDEALKWEDGDKKDGLIFNIANHMKKCYLSWNLDSVDDRVIFNHLYELSGGEINLKGQEEDLTESADLLKGSGTITNTNSNNHSNNNKRYKSNNKSRNTRGRKRY